MSSGLLLPRTETALAELAATTSFGFGEHLHGHVRTGMSGLYMGTATFEANRHDPAMIDPLAVMGIVMGEPHVRYEQPSKPLHVNVVADFADRQARPEITLAKQNLALALAYAVDRSLAGLGDQLYAYTIGDIPSAMHALGAERIPAEAQGKHIGRIAAEGLLTLVISDFEQTDLSDIKEDEMTAVVAVKVNHPLERHIPAGIGVVSLAGGWDEVNTNKPKQLAAKNDTLQAHHESVVTGLEAKGAQVVSVILEPREASKFNVLATDTDIASAINVYKLKK